MKGGVLLDFFKIRERNTKNGVEIYPDFIIGRHKDFMIRGHDFYAIYDADAGLWSTNEEDVQRLVDAELYKYYERRIDSFDGIPSVQYMSSYSSRAWANYRKYIHDSFDDYIPLDSKLIFANQKHGKKDYGSKTLTYALEKGDYSSWDEIVGTLYSEKEREKIEWAIGSIVAGESMTVDKFIVLYGSPGSGKGTILDIIAKLFDGYYTIFEAKALGSKTSEFGTAAFKNNPLVAIEYDSDLSRIENNTKLNSITSHETIPIRELYKAAYNVKINAFIFLATNEPVQITNAKSGIIRRLIDVNPSGNRIPPKRYLKLVDSVKFQLGAIAYHCMEVYQKLGRHYYDSYRPIDMMERTDVFFNFVEECYYVFKEDDGVSLKRAWSMFKDYVEDSALSYTIPKYKFKQELKEYFKEFVPDTVIDGVRVKNYYKGFFSWKVDGSVDKRIADSEACDDIDSIDILPWLDLTEEKARTSIFDEVMKNQPAQYANSDEIPFVKWESARGKLYLLDTRKLHYVKVPEDHIVIDFDIKDPATGEKSRELNLAEAAKWPPTYAEYSKSGQGLHLHYNYSGDVSKLRPIFSEGIEVKVFKGNSSLRRRLTACNDIPITTINSGLPLREEKRVINHDSVKSERKLRELIQRSLTKEFGATKPSVDFINHLLVEAKESGLSYDISDMKQAIMLFAMNSTNQSEYCMRVASEMPYKSEEPSKSGDGRYIDDRLVFFDIEVFPNLLLVNWKFEGSNTCVRMINPSPEEVGALFEYKLVGFNNRRYDNHVLYARYIGYTIEECYALSDKIINDKRSNAMFGEAYNISYTDVYDFASAAHKKGLKKWEIELGLHHHELGLPWDQPVPEDQWALVAEYCDNDVISTEAVFHHLAGDFRARQILADIAGMTVNDTTNALTTRIIFGKERKPKLHWYDLAEEFPGYQYKNGHNMYRGDDIGRGGWVYANPGMYGRCVTFDVASMHPRSIIMERYLGDYTDRFEDLVNIRLYIKHGDYDSVAKLFDGKLKPYLKNKEEAKDLSNALKTAINSVYGLTSASFDNPFRDRRNKNNIVACRGALFMRTLQDEVESRGFTVVHIKTDSIKVANPTPEIEKFINDFGAKYGYTFEVEAEWEKICLVNNAVFVGKQTVTSPQKPSKWTATGAQFQQPYVFKTLFSHEPLIFEDHCITMTTKTAFYLDMNEQLVENEHMPMFVGRAGSFCPIKSGCGGGLLMRLETDGRMSAATGTKGYRWLESEVVKDLHAEDTVDKTYFDKLVDEAVTDISKFGDYNWFVSDNSDIPWMMPCGDDTMDHCKECPHFHKDHDLCDLGFDISDILLTM